jgi:hypothetical protein
MHKTINKKYMNTFEIVIIFPTIALSLTPKAIMPVINQIITDSIKMCIGRLFKPGKKLWITSVAVTATNTFENIDPRIYDHDVKNPGNSPSDFAV